MVSRNDIIDIFNIFHDGTIERSVMDGETWRFEVFIPYLANRIKKEYTLFRVAIRSAGNFRFDGWLRELNKGTEELVEFGPISKEELEILSAEEKEADVIAVSCNIAALKSKFCGGNLYFQCGDAEVSDESGKQYTIDDLDELCKAYWDEWSKRSK